MPYKNKEIKKEKKNKGTILRKKYLLYRNKSFSSPNTNAFAYFIKFWQSLCLQISIFKHKNIDVQKYTGPFFRIFSYISIQVMIKHYP